MPAPDLTMLDWDQVRVFLAVARAGQLAGAAARLGLDVSTVSRRIDRLEAELGVHLFDRTREGTVVTAAAEAMLPGAEDMERGLAEFAAAVDAVEATAEGVVRLTAPPGVADAFVAPLLARFHAK
ncbi:MAG TPA: LysR family transcriptional regulator, partial [Minicystis sp.]|nr:LysR family transcriptional regulator [Minicystis sp.]